MGSIQQIKRFQVIVENTDDDFTPIGNLCYINENGEMLQL